MKKNFLIFILSTLFVTVTFAQPRIARQLVIGGSSNDDLEKICRTADGGFLAAGTSSSNQSAYKSQKSKGSTDFWIVKSVYDQTQKRLVKQWDKTIGGDARDGLLRAVPTRDGGFILGGTSTSGKSGDKSGGALGENDVWLVRTDNKGNVLWDTTIGDIKYDYLQSLDTTNDGGAILLYWHEAAAASASYLALLKLDAAGNTVWKQDTLNDKKGYLSVHQTTDGGYLFAAHASGKRVMIKTDASLNELWRTELGNSNAFNFNYEAKELKDGCYVFFGYEAVNYYMGTDDDDPDYAYNYYVVISKTDHSGKQLWSLNKYASYYSIYKVVFEELSTGGYLCGYDYDTPDSYQFDLLVNKIDNDGHLQWSDSIKTVDGSNRIADIIEAKPGIYIYGTTAFAGIGADKTKESLGGSDYWFIEVKDTSIIDPQTINSRIATPITQQERFNIYPNPAKDQLHVQVAGTAVVLLTDNNGKVIIRQTIQNSGTVNVQQLPAGMYYLKNNTTGVTKRVVITK